MDKEIKSLGIGLAFSILGLGVLGIMERYFSINPSAPGGWSTFKFVVVVFFGAGYFFGKQIFKNDEASEDRKDSDLPKND